MSAFDQHRQFEMIAEEGLPADYAEFLQEQIVPLADWLLQQEAAASAPLLVGINGAQGTGKTTLCKFLAAILSSQLGVAVLSLDDFYLTRAQRRQLAAEVHPLLATRGVPGTHDMGLLKSTLDQLLAGESACVPRFDKGSDDRVAEAAWRISVAAPSIVLLEGWCIGAPPQLDAELEVPLNRLEQEQDADGSWRRYVNGQLQGEYADLFARLSALVMLQAPSMDFVFEWRQLQEQKLRHQGGKQVMDVKQVNHFVQHYERLTRHCLAQLPASADYLMCLSQERDQVSGVVR
jgi:D-glycerate 3-kinase